MICLRLLDNLNPHCVGAERGADGHGVVACRQGREVVPAASFACRCSVVVQSLFSQTLNND